MSEPSTLRIKLAAHREQRLPPAPVRHLSGRVCLVRTATGDGRRAGVLRDISVSNIGLLLPREFPQGESLTIQPLRDDQKHQLLATVLSASYLNDGWLHECILAPVLHDEELRLWVP